MAIWKDSNGNFHDDMNGEALVLETWPKNLVKATRAEFKEKFDLNDDQLDQIFHE